MTDYLWEMQERSKQKNLFESHRRLPPEEMKRQLELEQKKVERVVVRISEFFSNRTQNI